MEILNIKNLGFKYPNEENFALNNVSLSVNKGDFVLLCGASGSGKTTLLRLLTKELAPFGEKTGSISFIDGSTCAIVTQDAENQILSDTVWHNLAFSLESMNKPSNEIRQKIAEIAEFFDLVHMFHKNTYSLSGGEKQLLNLASVMVTDPCVLLLDEPTSQLDPIAARRFIDIIKRLNSEMNLTVIISEHRTEELWSYADRVIIMDKGKIALEGSSLYVGENITDTSVQLPTPIALYQKLNKGGSCPLTVGESIKYLSDNYTPHIDYIEEITRETETALQLKDIYFRYSKNAADVLQKLCFSANFGEITTLLGGNGSGKTTLLSLLSGVNKPYSGKIKKNAQKIAVLPQIVKTVFTKDVLREDLSLISDNFHEVCNELEINHLLDKNPYDLSGGEAQRAALAKILLLKPDILCLDEPTKGIDAKGKKAIEKILKELAKRGVCVIIVSHDADFTAEVSDKCAFLFDGKIVSSGTPREIFSSNKFYTTYASRISRHMYKNTVTIDDVICLCQRNDKYQNFN